VEEWRCVEERVVHESIRRFLVRTYAVPDGTTQEVAIADQPPGVAVLALTPEGAVVLVRQFRPGPGRLMLDLPSGFVEGGEAVVDAARRELKEETGFEAESVRALGRTSPDAYGTEVRHVVVATGCRRTGTQDTDPGEDTDVVVVALDDLRRRLRHDELCTVDAAYLALDAMGLLGSSAPPPPAGDGSAPP
jgi:ADP-ribose pyrophosphatase